MGFTVVSILTLTFLILAPVICWFFHEKPWLWIGCLLLGEILAWGYVVPMGIQAYMKTMIP